MASQRAIRAWPLAIVIASVIGCEDPEGPVAPGSLMVVVSASGTDVRAFGYRASLNGGQPQPVDSATSRITFTQLEPRAHSVLLEGLAPNCSVVGQNPLNVTVVSGQTVLAQFLVSCVANVGNVRVATVTTGTDLDADGYTLHVDAQQHSQIGLNDVVTIPSLRVGAHSIALTGVASNCTVITANPLSANVTFGATTEQTFSIQCVGTGALEVTVTTSGVHVDPDGYTVAVHSANAGVTENLPVPPTGTVTFPRLRPATDYRVTLVGLAANCGLVGSSTRTLSIASGSTTRATFEVSCETPGLLAFVRNQEIYVIRSNGTGEAQLTRGTHAFDPDWSSSGKIAFTDTVDGNPEIYVMDEDGTNRMRLTTNPAADAGPSWSPDGSKIVFHSNRDGSSRLYTMNADGSGVTRITTGSADLQPAWSSTGKIAFISYRDGGNGEIYVTDADGSNVVRLTNNSLFEGDLAWSPDGSLLAFTREVGCDGCPLELDLFVMKADGSAERRLETGWTSSANHVEPSWSPDGQTIAFTRTGCYDYGCSPSEIWLADLEGTRLALIVSNAMAPSWRP